MGFSLKDIGRFLKSDKAKQIIGALTDDGPAPAPDIPPPVRTAPLTDAPPVTAPAAPLPPPKRVDLSAMPEPPTPMPPYIQTMEGLQPGKPNYSQARINTSDPTGISGVTYDDIAGVPNAPTLPAPVRTPMEPIAAAAPDAGDGILPPVRNVFIGDKFKPNATRAERAAAKLHALETADQGSKIRETPEGIEIDPPKKLSRLKAMGKMFLQRMMAGANGGIGGMLGAGIFGAVEGGVNPGHAQKVMRQGEREQATGEYAQAQTLEARGLQNQANALNIEQDRQLLDSAPQRQKDAEYEKERTNFEQGVSQLDKTGTDDPNRAKYIAALETEAARLSEKYGKTVTLIPGQGKEPTRFAVDGQVVEFGPDGKPKVVFGSPKTDDTAANHDQDADYKYQTTVAEVTAKRAAAEQLARTAEETALNYQQKVNEAAGRLSTLDSQMATMPAKVEVKDKDGNVTGTVANPALGPLERQRQQAKEQQTAAQSGMEAAYKTQREHQAKALEYVAPPPPPKRSRRAATAEPKILPRANLAAAADRLIKQGAIQNAAQAAAYLQGQGVTIQ